MKSLKILKKTGLGAAVLLLILELGPRLIGLNDYPLYDVDTEIGYIPAPGQKGKFLDRNDWVINELSMGTGVFDPNHQTDILLLGDSIVWGGNPYRQREKLGPQLQAASNGQLAVWPVGAGSWSSPNELTYLERHWTILRDIEVLVWICNSGDFTARTQWTSDVTHPRSRPIFSGIGALQRYLLPNLTAFPQPKPAELPGKLSAELPNFYGGLIRLRGDFPNLRIIVVWYPSKTEMEGQSESVAVLKESLAAQMTQMKIGVADLTTEPTWKPTLYKDDMHPTPEGYQILARILLRSIATP